jgi:hypothetical protein
VGARIGGEEARSIGVDAYLYLYPLVMMDITRRQATSPGGRGGLGEGPVNRFSHLREFPPAGFTAVVRPNFDTLYSSAWVDLSAGPVVVSTGPVPPDRFFQLPVYDMWTDAFASPGQRTTGSEAGDWALVPPGWSGPLPDGVGAIDAPTSTVWIIGRTQTNGPADYEAVHRIQDQFRLTPLDHWTDGAERDSDPDPADRSSGAADPSPGTADPDVDRETPPLRQLGAMPAEPFFDRALALLAKHPPHVTDWSLIARMARVGLVAGATFADLHPDVRSALADVPAGAQAVMAKALPRLANVVNGWQLNIDTMGVYGNSYVKRAIVAMVGLGANSAEDALYPLLQADAEGHRVRAEHDYVIHFDADGLPPVDAFWSVTMYDGQGFHVANDLDRFALGDRDQLSFNPDGSLDLYLQHASPGPGRESNWLPSPEGPIGVTMRLYAPKPAALDGSWSPPPVTRRS